AMSFGYVIPLCADLTLERDQLTGQLRQRELDMASLHNFSQVEGAPFAQLPILKFHNPWIIQTPPGYSTLVLPLLNRFDLPFQALSGLVETDTYYQAINFPAIMTFQPGQRVRLPQGTPLVQVMPILREEFQAGYPPFDEAKSDSQLAQMHENRHFYKELYWQK